LKLMFGIKQNRVSFVGKLRRSVQTMAIKRGEKAMKNLNLSTTQCVAITCMPKGADAILQGVLTLKNTPSTTKKSMTEI